MQVHTAQLAGGERNADRVFVTDNAVIVLDGATAFEPVHVDAGTYAETLGARIADLLDDTPEMDLSHAVAPAIRHATDKLHLRANASPSSTIAILRARPASVDLYALGDSPIYFGVGQEVHRFADDRLASLPLGERSQYVNTLRSGHGFGSEHLTLLRRLQRAQRTYRNRSHGYWIAEAAHEAAFHARLETIPVGCMTWAVLASDGTADAVDYSGLPPWHEIAKFNSGELMSLLWRLHEWELNADPDGQARPRAKRHDDKTIASVLELDQSPIVNR